MSKGLYERRQNSISGLNDIALQSGKTISFVNTKGNIEYVTNLSSADFTAYASRVILRPADELSSATVAAITPTGNIAAISLPTLDPSASAAEAFEASFVLDETVEIDSSLTINMYAQVDETVHTTTPWGAAAAKIPGNIVKPVAAQSNGFYYIVTLGTGNTGGAEPVWPTVAGGTVVDNAVTWTAFNPLVNFEVQMLGITDSQIWEFTAFAAAVGPTADIEVIVPSADYTSNGYPMNLISFDIDISTFTLVAGDVVFFKLVRPATTLAANELDNDLAIHSIELVF